MIEKLLIFHKGSAKNTFSNALRGSVLKRMSQIKDVFHNISLFYIVCIMLIKEDLINDMKKLESKNFARKNN